jgi:hypothetical protein
VDFVPLLAGRDTDRCPEVHRAETARKQYQARRQQAG